MFDSTAVLLIGLICLAVGLVIGLLLASLRNAGAAKDQAPQGEHDPPVEGVRLWRERAGGRLLVELDGRPLEEVEKLSPDQRLHLEKAAADFATWLARSPARGEPLPAGRPEAPVAPPPPVANPAKQGPVDVLVKAFQADVKTAPAERSIAAQIDEILQERLASPAYAASGLKNKGIRLMELPGKGLVVLVGLEQYAGIDEVPDPEIKALIRSCVAEWENRMAS